MRNAEEQGSNGQETTPGGRKRQPPRVGRDGDNNKERGKGTGKKTYIEPEERGKDAAGKGGD